MSQTAALTSAITLLASSWAIRSEDVGNRILNASEMNSGGALHTLREAQQDLNEIARRIDRAVMEAERAVQSEDDSPAKEFVRLIEGAAFAPQVRPQ